MSNLVVPLPEICRDPPPADRHPPSRGLNMSTPTCDLPSHPGRLAVGLVAVAVTLSGCVSARYRMSPTGTPPPIALNLSAPGPQDQPGAAPAAATLHTIIIQHGPGSWKREALWDEYVISVVNQGGPALTVESAALVDYQNTPLSPGDNPWALEKTSRTWWQQTRNSAAADTVKIGAGAFATGTAAGTVVFAASASSMGWGAFAAAGTAFAIAAPAYAVGMVAANLHGKHAVETEFNRRRLALPATLASGKTAQGSLFFRIAPGPQRLVLHCRAADGPTDIVFPLHPFANLHLNPAAGAERPAAVRPGAQVAAAALPPPPADAPPSPGITHESPVPARPAP
jgi:hypothetical protein